MPETPTTTIYLSSTMRALLQKAAPQQVAVLMNPDGRIINVGWIGQSGHEFRPLGVRLALSAGYVTVTSLEDTPAALRPWRALQLTPLGAEVLAADQARAKGRKRGGAGR